MDEQLRLRDREDVPMQLLVAGTEFCMKVARSALRLPVRPLEEGRGEGDGHGGQRLSWFGAALVAMDVSPRGIR